MGANEKHAAAYHGRTDTTIAQASASLPAPTVVESGFGDVDVAAAESDDYYEDLLRKVQG